MNLAQSVSTEQAGMQGIGLSLRLLIIICVGRSQEEGIDKDQPGSRLGSG